MAARTTMANLITELRGMCNAGTADYTLAGVTHWSDDQLQAALDKHRTDLHFVEVIGLMDYSTGVYITIDYPLPPGRYEETVEVLQIDGAAYGTALYSIDYNRSLIEFASSNGAAGVYINASSYDLNRAAADVWRKKAAYYSTAYDISSDGQSLKRSQLVAQAMQMVNYFSSQAGVTTVQLRRGDE